MALVGAVIQQAFKQWFTESMHYTIGVIRDKWLVGPHPQRLTVQTGNLRNRIFGRVLPDGFAVGTNVKYGIYWEQGIKAHDIVPKKPGGVLMIPVASSLKGWNKQASKATGFTKLRKASKMQKRAGNLVIFRKKVHVPAQKPRKFLEPGAREALPVVLRSGFGVFNRALSAQFGNKTVKPR